MEYEVVHMEIQVCQLIAYHTVENSLVSDYNSPFRANFRILLEVSTMASDSKNGCNTLPKNILKNTLQNKSKTYCFSTNELTQSPVCMKAPLQPLAFTLVISMDYSFYSKPQVCHHQITCFLTCDTRQICSFVCLLTIKIIIRLIGDVFWCYVYLKDGR